MPNTLTDLIPEIQSAVDTVAREQVGFIPAVTMDPDVARAAVGQTVRSPVAPASTASDVTPSVTPPDDGDQDIGNVTMTISKSRRVPVRWNGEQTRGVGGQYNNIVRDQFAQAMRTLTNEVETDLAALYRKASRAYGTAGTTPFATGVGATAQLLKILKDNGAPQTDLQLIIDTTAGAAMRTNTQLTKVNESGSDSMLRQGVLLDVHNFAIRESAQVHNHVKGTGTGYLVNNGGGEAVGETALSLDTGTGTILTGDILTHASDSANKYVVSTALTTGEVSIANPGLLVAAADDDAVSVGNNYTANLGFHRSAIHLATRAPALPEQGDLAVDRMMITDPVSGLSFEVSMYMQYRQVQYEVALAWGVELVKPEFAAILLG